MNTMAGNSDKLVSTLRALQQQSNNVGTDIGNSLGSQLMSRTNTALAAGGGGLLGAGLGGAAGYLAGKDDSKQKDSSGLTTLIGALGGGGAGLLGGGMMADTMFKNAFEKGWVKAATTVGLNEKQAFALLPSWGGQK
ncbi:MAG: hypothetical protein EBU46_00985, partial [Nitrosomonadaceae bacterium]|nr:hypothetical protein [Nitrosomonadaceae bacterium]